jgi:small subunit ribosomal protein S5
MGRQAERSFDEQPEFDEVVVKIYRCAKVVKGGRRFSFGAVVVTGDRNGRVGVGYGKANEVPLAVEKAGKAARKNLQDVQLREGTLPHRVIGRCGASRVMLLPAPPGTGIIAGACVRPVLELAGVRDCLTKSHGSRKAKNLVKAALNGLLSLRAADQVAAARNVKVDSRPLES